MAWKTISDRRYYYKSERQGDRVKSTYFTPLLAERASLCWFILNSYESAYANASGWNISQADLQHRKIDKAHARFLSAPGRWPRSASWPCRRSRSISARIKSPWLSQELESHLSARLVARAGTSQLRLTDENSSIVVVENRRLAWAMLALGATMFAMGVFSQSMNSLQSV